MWEIIISILLGLVFGIGAGWFVWRHLPQEKIREINYQKIVEEQALLERQRSEGEQIIADLDQQREQRQKDYDLMISTNSAIVDELQHKIFSLRVEYTKEQGEITNLQTQKTIIQNSLIEMQNQAQQQADAFLASKLELAEERLAQALEAAGLKYQEDEEAYRQEYEKMVAECAQAFSMAIADYQLQISEATHTLQELQGNIDAMVANAKREEQKRQEKNFYRLVLPESDLEEIRKLRSVEPYLRDKEALNKVIWKVYYEKPYTDMIGRVIGSKLVTGIYKITNIDNNMCYVGQAANVADRWRQHIKRGIGAEAPTRNKLYPAMLAFGVENFTFELLEECERDKLDEREDHWQNVYHAKDYGYSIK